MFKPWEAPTVETKPDPFSLDALIAWLRTKPGEEEYPIGSIDNCLICQYAKAAGKWTNFCDATEAFHRKSGRMVVQESVAYSYPKTFGAALDRALALKAGGAQ